MKSKDQVYAEVMMLIYEGKHQEAVKLKNDWENQNEKA